MPLDDHYAALRALLSDTRRLFPEERSALVFLLGRVIRLEEDAKRPAAPAKGFPVLPRVRP